MTRRRLVARALAASLVCLAVGACDIIGGGSPRPSGGSGLLPSRPGGSAGSSASASTSPAAPTAPGAQTEAPTAAPTTANPTAAPVTPAPTPEPTPKPTPAPTAPPATSAPTAPPAASATPKPSATPTAAASPSATPAPTASASPSPSETPTVAEQLQAEFQAVIADVAPSVVMIDSTAGRGSGFVFDDQGNIVTTAAVVGGARIFIVTASDGTRAVGRLSGRFDAGDLAVIHIDNAKLPPVQFGNSDDVVVGSFVLAVGNQLGVVSSVTNGIVSGIGRPSAAGGEGVFPTLIQTTALVNAGNSGGILVNLAGEVIGMPTLAVEAAEPWLGFAIPASSIQNLVPQMIASKRVIRSDRASMGVTALDTPAGTGALVYAVDPGGPADTAGIVAGDVIVSVNGAPTPDRTALRRVLRTAQPGDPVPVVIQKPDGTQSTVTVTLDELP